MNKTIFYILFVTGLIFSVTACQQKPRNQMILFLEQEEGTDPYQTRLIVTPEYLRFDEGDQSESYLLVDRKSRTVHSVNHQTKSIMRIDPKNVKVTPPIELNYTVNDLDDLKGAPSINDKKPEHRQLLTNGKVCLDVVSVDGLLPEAVTALTEYHQMLAADSAVTFNDIPADMQEPCAMSMTTFAPTRHLDYGFPIQEWKPGYFRHLETFDDNFEVNPELLILPEGYFSFSVQEFREGRVDIENRKIFPKPEQVTPQAGIGDTAGKDVQPSTKTE